MCTVIQVYGVEGHSCDAPKYKTHLP